MSSSSVGMLPPLRSVFDVEITHNRLNPVVTSCATPRLPAIDSCTLMISLAIRFKVQGACRCLTSIGRCEPCQSDCRLVTDIQTTCGPREVVVRIVCVAFAIATLIQVEVAVGIPLFECVVLGVRGGGSSCAVDDGG
jgi:hypothetical protein